MWLSRLIIKHIHLFLIIFGLRLLISAILAFGSGSNMCCVDCSQMARRGPHGHAELPSQQHATDNLDELGTVPDM